MSDERFAPAKEIADYFGVTPAAIYKYTKLGKIHARRIGGAVRITREEFEYIKANGLRESEASKSDEHRRPRTRAAT